jgi:ribosomal protein S18 acetylase RimI-like enzyme
MKTEFRKAVLPRELQSLLAFDRRIFTKSDRITLADWKTYKSYWMLIDDTKVGCSAFEEHVDFHGDIREDGLNTPRRGSLYIVTTGILPRFQRMGFGTLLKAWEVAYARHYGFTRIVANTRSRNDTMIALNKRYHFRVVRTSPRYYSDPTDSTVVMELRLT